VAQLEKGRRGDSAGRTGKPFWEKNRTGGGIPLRPFFTKGLPAPLNTKPSGEKKTRVQRLVQTDAIVKVMAAIAAEKHCGGGKQG